MHCTNIFVIGSGISGSSVTALLSVYRFPVTLYIHQTPL